MIAVGTLIKTLHETSQYIKLTNTLAYFQLLENEVAYRVHDRSTSAWFCQSVALYEWER